MGMAFFLDLALTALKQVWVTFSHNWPILLLGSVVAAIMTLYMDKDRVAALLQRRQGVSVLASVGAAVTTPLCSCGTTAMVLSMMASTVPWAPIVAFMVASPMTSPGELFYSASLFGWPFALTYFLASILLGLAGGAVAYVAEQRGWLRGQARFHPVTGGSGLDLAGGDNLALPVVRPAKLRPTWRDLARETWVIGRRLLVFFLSFAFIGYLLNGLIPQSWIGTLFGPGRVYGVPLAATLGLPFYINTEASLPLVRSLFDLGMSPGATLAFLITGAGTSIGAISGALTIARWRVVGIVVGTLWFGAMVVGFAYNLMLA